MAKYIDAEKIKFTGDVSYDDEGNVLVALEDVKRAIAQTPDADVVEVVRCKDCKYWENGKDYVPYCNHYGNMMTDTIADQFCSYGERKDKTK